MALIRTYAVIPVDVVDAVKRHGRDGHDVKYTEGWWAWDSENEVRTFSGPFATHAEAHVTGNASHLVGGRK